MTQNELREIFLSDVKHVNEEGEDLIKGRVVSLYPKKLHFSDKINFKTFQIIYTKDMLNNVLAYDLFPSTHKNLKIVMELNNFIPSMYFIIAYWFFTYNYSLRFKYKSNLKAHLYSFIIPIGGCFLINLIRSSAEYHYDLYLKEDIFNSDPNLAEDKILSFKVNTIQYNDFKYRYHLKSRKVIYTDAQIADIPLIKKTES